ncbi:MAG: hypothetical protein P0Y56_12915 [Candidatus Andeanibacterium colombiense]|uniref:DUF8021 domain-containing protein n=1 Tax=Candidatus Andeanibacterium colombiense TaxID=3121345 RepID=A0AAJ5X4K6_9SPHN|nr:MAG: hypothetical protein P0Y56_12915 [Sphingomonadaceae bacterium]
MEIRTKSLAGIGLSLALAACNQAGSTGAATEAKPVCDRDCLIELTDNYVASFAKHGTTGVPLSDEVKIVEDLKPIKAGEGLWTDVTSGPTQFQIHVPDPVRETAGWIGMVERDGKPTIVAIRLKLDAKGSIAEAEHLYALIDTATPMGKSQIANLQAVRPGLLAEVPEANRKSEADLLKIGASYYDALDDNDGTKMPFAADCERHENGMVTAGPKAGPGPNGPQPHPIAHDCAGQLSSKVMTYIGKIDNRRVFAADPVTGLVMGLSHFHHPMDFPPYEVTALDGTKIEYTHDKQMKFDPFDLPAAHIFKIGADGKVHEIEAMGFQAPLNSPTGWGK